MSDVNYNVTYLDGVVEIKRPPWKITQDKDGTLRADNGILVISGVDGVCLATLMQQGEKLEFT